ncbi:E2F-associated phosphoprotein [Zostera marina]|uniref:E2F-associated phosphoprotein n=1 Tax=Zostera marina TaxID=29655 RepID=A0A0K9Q1T1_ZOSMR|nr:E2F-associated phosphoprotein [Zostera marina]
MDTDRTVSSDDEIDYSVKPDFYDSNLDDRDEVWVHKRRKDVTTDAVLSCPACLNMVCIDCQRHEKYVTQYRAMFVFNCKIKEIEVKHAENAKPEELLWPVCCAVCDTKLGVFDQDEVYHFFDVLPSN